MSSEPLFDFDPVKWLKRALGLEEATPAEQQAEVAKPEPEKPTTTIQPISPVETMPASQEPTPEPQPTPTSTVQPLPQPEPLPEPESKPPVTQIAATASISNGTSPKRTGRRVLESV